MQNKTVTKLLSLILIIIGVSSLYESYVSKTIVEGNGLVIMQLTTFFITVIGVFLFWISMKKSEA